MGMKLAQTPNMTAIMKGWCAHIERPEIEIWFRSCYIDPRLHHVGCLLALVSRMSDSSTNHFLKVLHLCWEMPPRVTGGLGVACAGWVDALRDRCALSLIRADQWIEQSGDHALTTYGGYGGYGGGELWRASQEFSKEVLRQCSEMQLSNNWVVHAHDWMTVEAGMLLQRHFGAKLVTHWHSSELERRGMQARNVIFDLEKLAMERSDGVVAVSQVSAESMQREYAVESTKLRVIYHGGNAGELAAVKKPIPESILFASRLCEQKGAQFMMAVAARMLAERPRLTVIIAGDGELMPMLRAEAGFRNWGNRVLFLGQVPLDKMARVYEIAGVLCLPSHAEPFGLVAMEAAAAGVPVVLSEYCGAAEILTHAPRLRVGDIDAWCGAIHALFEDHGKYRAVVNMGKEKAAKRTWRMAAGEMLELYAQLVD